MNSTPPSVTQKELLLEAFVLEEVQRAVKTRRLLCSLLPPAVAAMLCAASCLEHSSRWFTSRCQGRQRYGRSFSEEVKEEEEEEEEEGPL